MLLIFYYLGLEFGTLMGSIKDILHKIAPGLYDLTPAVWMWLGLLIWHVLQVAPTLGLTSVEISVKMQLNSATPDCLESDW